ncbi:hypothetical protein [Alteraurantiacibacter aquimixticola]|uniref:Uncharacterized protein n=1 Tax=Alteraurantiacibacter aquimixticola TaxID=2489173 RepID=A0A4T3EYJ4_9SPHN|nr:hypothetical protein [Alteraurantiacibacter aquimixticola]TIX49151.1 hypothetical protein E5222_15650 [Alteraurantiacibacter aquimixticola]
MPKYPAILAATAALGALALPAVGQSAPIDDRYAGVAEQQDDGWEGEAQAGASYTVGEETVFEPVDVDAAIGPVGDEASDAPASLEYASVGPDAATPARTPVLGYSPAQRAEWLSQCRTLRPGPRRRYSAEDRVSSPDESHGIDYCEAYLLNYERGYGVPTQVMAPMAGTPAPGL